MQDFNAASRSNLVSRARYTSPMPPAPTNDTIRCAPNCSPVSGRSWTPGISSAMLRPTYLWPGGQHCVRETDSTSRRSASSPRHACARNSGRSLATLASAASQSCHTTRRLSRFIACRRFTKSVSIATCALHRSMMDVHRVSLVALERLDPYVNAENENMGVSTLFR